MLLSRSRNEFRPSLQESRNRSYQQQREQTLGMMRVDDLVDDISLTTGETMNINVPVMAQASIEIPSTG